MTGKAVIHATMSLDGFIAGPDDDMSWMSDYVGPNRVADEVIRTAGAVVSGSRLFRLIQSEDQLPYGGATKVPVFVLSHHPQEPITQFGVTFSFITDGLEVAIKRAKSAAGDKNVMLFGASIAQQCLKLGLVDEIQIHLVPLLLGAGVRLFDGMWAEGIRLVRIQLVESPKVTDLRFRVLS